MTRRAIRWPLVRRSRLEAAEAQAKFHRQRAFLLRDALEQVSWRLAMNLGTIDEKAAYRVCNFAIDRDRATTTLNTSQGEG